MKILELRARDWLCHHDSTVATRGLPVVTLVGPNDAGKSALADAIRWALTNEARGAGGTSNRVLVRRGADTCRVDLSLVHGTETLALHRTPTTVTPGNTELLRVVGAKSLDALAAALHVGAFLDLKPRERQALVYRLSGLQVDAALLAQHGVTDPDVVAACLARGMESGERLAAERKRAANREADAAEVPPPQDEVVDLASGQVRLSSLSADDVRRTLAALRQERDGILNTRTDVLARASVRNAAMARLNDATAAWAAAGKREAGGKSPADLRAAAEALPDLRLEPVPKPTAPVPKPEPDVGRAAAKVQDARDRHLRARAALEAALSSPWDKVRTIAERLNVRMPEGDPLAAELVALADANGGGNLDALRTAVTAAEQAVAAAQDAHHKAQGAVDAVRQENMAARVAWEATCASVNTENTARLKRLEAATAEAGRLQGLAAKVEAAKARLDEAQRAADATPEPGEVPMEPTALSDRLVRGEGLLERLAGYHAAAKRHQDAAARIVTLRERAALYAGMEAALKPGGLVSTLIAQPLETIRAVVAEVSARMLPRPVVVTDGWDVTYDGGAVSLASTSVRWRVAAALGIALGVVSGLRWCVLDEASVCVGKAQAALWGALLAAGQFYDQVVVLASVPDTSVLPAIPEALRGTVARFVVDGGKVEARP